MLPIVTFPQVTICGTKDDCLKWSTDESHVTFKARLNATQNGVRSIYIFNAFNEVAERIKRMKICPKSECTIIAEMREYIDKDNIRRQSFTVKLIDYVKTNDSFEKNKVGAQDSTENSASQKPASQAPQQTQKPQNNPPVQKQEESSSCGIDIDEFARSFSC